MTAKVRAIKIPRQFTHPEDTQSARLFLPGLQVLTFQDFDDRARNCRRLKSTKSIPKQIFAIKIRIQMLDRKFSRNICTELTACKTCPNSPNSSADHNFDFTISRIIIGNVEIVMGRLKLQSILISWTMQEIWENLLSCCPLKMLSPLFLVCCSAETPSKVTLASHREVFYFPNIPATEEYHRSARMIREKRRKLLKVERTKWKKSYICDPSTFTCNRRMSIHVFFVELQELSYATEANTHKE